MERSTRRIEGQPMVDYRSRIAQPLPPAEAPETEVDPVVPAEETVTTARFNGELWRRFLRLAKPYWTLDKRWVARGMLVLLIGLLLGLTEFSVLFNQQSGEITSALAARESSRFWVSIWQFF